MSKQARRLLADTERQSRERILREFYALQLRTKDRFQKLISEIESRRQQTGTVPVSFLFERDRMATMLVDIQNEITQMTASLTSTVTAAQRDAVDIAQTTATAEIQSVTGKGSIVRFDPVATSEIIGNTAANTPLADLMMRLPSATSLQLKQLLIDGVANGDGSRQLAGKLKTALGTTTAQALTIARTEQNQAYRQASLVTYQENDDIITGWMWFSALDLRTCMICWSRHGQIFPLKKKPSSHPNCRCTMLPHMPESAAVQTGEEKFLELTPAQKTAILGEKRFQLYKDGLNLSDFIGETKTKYGLTPYIKALVDLPVPAAAAKRPAAPKAVTVAPVAQKQPAAPKAAPVKKSKAAKAPKQAPDFNWSTAKQAEQAMRSKYPDKVFDFTGMDQRLINENAQEFDRLAKLFPEVADRIKYIGTYVRKEPIPSYTKRDGTVVMRPPTGREWLGSNSAYAHAQRDGTLIGLNPAFYNDYDSLKKKRQNGRDTGWSVSEKTIGSMTHEFGHHIDFYLQDIAHDTALAPETLPDGSGKLAHLFEKWKRKYKAGRDTSVYATTKPVENFSEGFSMIHNRPESEWSEYARRQKQLIDFVFANKQPASGKVVHDPDKQKEIKKKLKAIYKDLGLVLR